LALVPALFSLVKFAHTVFALPFALAGALLARMEIPSAGRIGWILLAMAGARSLAMALNRLIDMPLDARNPRTAGRELPSGKLTRSQVIVFSAGSLAALLVAVSQLPRLTWVLWPIPVALFVIYPYMKRFSWTCHLVLGISIGIAPIGGWVAVTGSVAPAAFALWIAVAAWVAGFDMLYALLDVESDRATGIHSVPVRFGERGALIGCRILHAISVAAMVAAGLLVDAGAWYAIGVAVCALILLWENIAVRGGDRRAVAIAFGVANGVVAFVYFAFVLIEVVSR
jgi:4-hydroxybenzoate polyprenyltransferase